jgi:hypothetical protein
VHFTNLVLFVNLYIFGGAYTGVSRMGEGMVYKVSFVVEGGKHPGAIINTDKEPKVGDVINLDGLTFEITEVDELMPPAGDFGFLHATCRALG